MSDTPRTDDLATRRAYAIGRGDLAVCWKEMANHARQLERELNQASAELKKHLTSEVDYEIVDGIRQLAQVALTNSGLVDSLTQENEQLRARYAAAAELLKTVREADDEARGNGYGSLGNKERERIDLFIASTPQSVKDVMDVLEAVKAYDSAISALEKEHGRKDMELTQHSKLVPIRELARKL